jgi:hypothetical protein
MNLGIVCASLPALKPLIVKIIPRFATQQSRRPYGIALSDYVGNSPVLGSKGTHCTSNGGVELPTKPIHANAYSLQADPGVSGNVYVTQQFEQHVEETRQSSDTKSRKDLVAKNTFSSTYQQR